MTAFDPWSAEQQRLNEQQRAYEAENGIPNGCGLAFGIVLTMAFGALFVLGLRMIGMS